MDLKSFSATESEKADPYHGWRDPNVLNTKNEKQSATEADVKKAIGEYSKLSNDQLMIELAKQIGLQKEKGNHAQMKETIERIKPFLDATQKKRLSDIIESMGI
ncbi:MAG: hypothetical protein FWE38_01880 [Firmicutes bacterium]|nr:hypothetical protein [Bacillota bacterium]